MTVRPAEKINRFDGSLKNFFAGFVSSAAFDLRRVFIGSLEEEGSRDQLSSGLHKVPIN